MPYKTVKIKIDCPFLDKRCKLLPCQVQMIKHWRDEGASQRMLAKMFGVSRRLIQFKLDEQKLKANIERRQERGGTKQYYDKEKHREYTKKHRKDKHRRLKDVV